jgi:hypothetical protein
MEFYVIENKRFISRYAYAEEVEPIKYGDPDYCNVCGKPLNIKKWLPPYKVVLEKPVFGDFIYGSFSEMLVSERFMNEYKMSGLKGIISFHPVEIVKVKNKKNTHPTPPQYFKIQIIRSETAIDEKASGFKREFSGEDIYCKFCQNGGIIKSFKGIFIKESSWTGEDVFYAKGLSGTIFATQYFADFLMKYGFSNIELIKSKQYWPVWAGGPPPKLS